MPNIPWAFKTVTQLTLIGVCDTSQIVNVFHFMADPTYDNTLTSDGLAATAAAGLAADWITTTKPVWLACHASDYTLQLVKAQVIERPGQFRRKLSTTETTLTSTNTGTLGYAADNLHTAACLRWRTAVAGKTFRGRTYIGPVPNAQNTNGTITTAERTTYVAFGTHMLATWGTSGLYGDKWELVVYSRPYNMGEYGYPRGHNPNRTWFYPPDYGGLATVVTASNLDPNLRVQRRRELGVGS